MKSLVLASVVCLASATVSGQELLWQFVNAAGFDDGNEISVYWTLGESLSVETIGDNGSLRVGFMAYTGASEPDFALPTPEAPSYNRDIDLSVFPNPTEDYFEVSTEESGTQTIRVFGIDGTQLMQDTFESRLSVNIASWPSGTYNVMLVNTEGKFNTTKLIKL